MIPTQEAVAARVCRFPFPFDDDRYRPDPTRVVELPHMRPACWDALMWGLTQLAADTRSRCR